VYRSFNSSQVPVVVPVNRRQNPAVDINYRKQLPVIQDDSGNCEKQDKNGGC
jgi:hypothetical protein